MLRPVSPKFLLIETACSLIRSGKLTSRNSPCLRQADAPYTADGSTNGHPQLFSAAFMTLGLKTQKTRPSATPGTTYQALRHNPRPNTIACRAVAIGTRNATMLAEENQRQHGMHSAVA